MLLNDEASDDEPQLLLPYVTRLACADNSKIECERAGYIQWHMLRGSLNVERGVEILEAALAIGKQAEPLALDVVRTRMEAARGQAPVANPKRSSPLLKKVGSWLTAELEPAD